MITELKSPDGKIFKWNGFQEAYLHTVSIKEIGTPGMPGHGVGPTGLQVSLEYALTNGFTVEKETVD